ncbi:MAG: DUF4280 domain-containing protein [Lachnospiraceae bacterium]|nr:DUF4280 domain-containing protein [Lachnospiraceae bacterium]
MAEKEKEIACIGRLSVDKGGNMDKKINVKGIDFGEGTNFLIRHMQDRITGNFMFNGIEEIKKEEILEAIKEKEKENLNPVVEYAEVRCSEMEMKGPVLARSNSLVVDVRNGASGLTIDDIVLEPGSFGYCKAMQKECKPGFLTDRWEKGDTKNLVNGRPALIMGSYLICVAGKGEITPYTDGQVVAAPITAVSKEYIDFLIQYESSKGTKWQYAHEPGDGTVTIAHGVVIKDAAGNFPLGEDKYNEYMMRKENNDPLTVEEAYDLTIIRLEDYITKVRNKIEAEGWEVTQNRFDAMVDMVWNLGDIALGYNAVELLAIGDLSDPEIKRQLEIEILETAKSNGMWLKNLTERRLDLVQMAEENTYEINPMTDEEWNNNAYQLFLDKGVDQKIVEDYPFQKVG